jgi:acetyl esterase/lipase
MADRDAMRQRSVVLTQRGMDQARIRKGLLYGTSDTQELRADVYSPPGPQHGTRLPAVIFVSGDGPPELLQGLKDSGQYVGWGQLTAAAGMIAVTFDHSSTERHAKLHEVEREVLALLGYVREHAEELGIDVERLGIWTCSGGPPFALRMPLSERPSFIRCLVAYYGIMDLRPLIEPNDPEEAVQRLTTYSPAAHLGPGTDGIAPLLLVRAGQDHPGLTRSIDGFVAEALAQNHAIEIINYPQGHHAFDILDDTDEARTIMRRTLDFLGQHLAS